MYGISDGTLLTAKFGAPTYLAIDGAGNLYISDHISFNYDSIRRLSVANNNVTTMAGKTCKSTPILCDLAVYRLITRRYAYDEVRRLF